MSVNFWLLCGAMLIVAAAFVIVLPKVWRRSEKGESTADWVRLRRRELAGAEGQLLDEVDLRALEDLGGGELHEPMERRSDLPLWWLPLALLAASYWLYGYLGNLEDVLINDDLVTLEPESPEAVEAVIARIEARVQDRPENLDYLSLLGEYHAARGDHASALPVYEAMLALLPENPEVLGRASQAEFLANERQLSDTARRRAEAALAVDPQQRAALGTLGMAAFEAQDYAAAVSYWERMLVQEPPGTPAYNMMAGVIAQARQRGGLAATEADALPTEAAAQTIGITVTVSLPEGAQVDPSAAVFVLARPSGAQSRMPTAVVRRAATEWPLTVRLTDAEAMAGQKLSTLESVEVEVQISPTGQPGLANASWTATANNVVPSRDATVSLSLSPAP